MPKAPDHLLAVVDFVRPGSYPDGGWQDGNTNHHDTTGLPGNQDLLNSAGFSAALSLVRLRVYDAVGVHNQEPQPPKKAFENALQELQMEEGTSNTTIPTAAARTRWNGSHRNLIDHGSRPISPIRGWYFLSVVKWSTNSTYPYALYASVASSSFRLVNASWYEP